MVMELLSGLPLSARLETERPPIAEGLRILAGVTAALGAAHAVGVVHRDLKPENVFLCERWRRRRAAPIVERLARG